MNTTDVIIDALSEFVVRASKPEALGKEVEALPDVARVLSRYLEIKDGKI